MCTVSWIHQPDGYHLLCNRDEKKTRSAGLGPRIHTRGGVRFIAPVDPEFGGTWIAVNQFGLGICLLNGANVTGRPLRNLITVSRSRGLLLPDLISSTSADECILSLRQLDLSCFYPFTLVLLEPREPAVIAEWDGNRITTVRSANSLMPLTSSSWDAEGVRIARRREFARRAAASSVIDAPLLHAFHSSHAEEAGAYSPCMHRAEAETVSFSWASVTHREVRFLYSPGAPCRFGKSKRRVLSRAA